MAYDRWNDPPGWNSQWEEKMRKITNPLEEEIETLKSEVSSLEDRICALEGKMDND